MVDEMEDARWASSRSGLVRVCATSGGLPVEVRLDDDALAAGVDDIAAEVLRLARDVARAIALERREILVRGGVEPEVLDALGLPRRGEIADAEVVDDWAEGAPRSWLRSV